jgi:dUTP pyrophosphatase
MTPITIDCALDDPRYLPTRAKPGDAGLDLKARTDTAIELYPNDQKLIMTGVKIAIPHGWVGFVTPRSGLALKARLHVTNAPGTIDSGYRAELGVILWNQGTDLLKFEDGERIAQLVILPAWMGDLEVVDALDGSERGMGGFGHTGS